MAEAAGRVGLFLGASRDNRYQALLALEAEQAARKHGFLLEAFFAEGVAAQQSGLIVRFLHAHKDPRLGVVVQTVNDADASGGSLEDSPVHKLARRVLGKGAGWIVVNR